MCRTCRTVLPQAMFLAIQVGMFSWVLENAKLSGKRTLFPELHKRNYLTAVWFFSLFNLIQGSCWFSNWLGGGGRLLDPDLNFYSRTEIVRPF